MHRWSDDDNLIAYCFYRFGEDVFGKDRQELGDILGMGFNSFGLKIANFKAIDGLGGLEQYSQQALRIFTRYSKLSDEEVRQAGNAALQRASDGTSSPQKNSDASLSREAVEAKLAQAQRTMERLQAQLDRIQRK